MTMISTYSPQLRDFNCSDDSLLGADAARPSSTDKAVQPPLDDPKVQVGAGQLNQLSSLRRRKAINKKPSSGTVGKGVNGFAAPGETPVETGESNRSKFKEFFNSNGLRRRKSIRRKPSGGTVGEGANGSAAPGQTSVETGESNQSKFTEMFYAEDMANYYYGHSEHHREEVLEYFSKYLPRRYAHEQVKALDTPSHEMDVHESISQTAAQWKQMYGDATHREGAQPHLSNRAGRRMGVFSRKSSNASISSIKSVFKKLNSNRAETMQESRAGSPSSDASNGDAAQSTRSSGQADKSPTLLRRSLDKLNRKVSMPQLNLTRRRSSSTSNASVHAGDLPPVPPIPEPYQHESARNRQKPALKRLASSAGSLFRNHKKA